MRSFRAVDLANYDVTRNVTVNNVSYSINSTADWVRDSTGGTQSCSNNATQADYMRVTTTTTSNLINTPIPPIKMSSLVAPPDRRLRREPGHARDPGHQPRRRGRRGGPRHDHGPHDDHQRDQLDRLRDLRLRPDRDLHGHRQPGGLGRPRRQHQRHRRRDRQRRHGQRQDDRLRPGSQRAGDVRHRDPRRRDRPGLHDAAVGRQRRRALRAVLPLRGDPHLRSHRRRHRDHRGHQPLPVRGRLRPLRRRLPRRRPHQVHHRLLRPVPEPTSSTPTRVWPLLRSSCGCPRSTSG